MRRRFPASPPAVRRILAAAVLWWPSSVVAQTMSLDAESGTWALTNARIETITKGTIEKGTIVIRNGVIAAVGAGIAAPADARIVDLAGKTIYPGFFDLTSSLGVETTQPGGGRGGRGAALNLPPGITPEMVAAFLGGGDTTGAAQRNVGLEPGRVIANEFRPTVADVRSWRDVGVTTALVAPPRGLFRGLSALVPLRDDTAKHWIVRSPVAEHIGYQTVPGQYPGSLMGVIAYQRQAFYDAKRYAMIQERYKANPTGMPRTSYDANLDALVPVVKGELPAFVNANEENEILRALALGKEFGFKVTIVGATEGFEVADALKAARNVVVSVNFPEPTAVTGWQYYGTRRDNYLDTLARTNAVKSKIEANAGALSKAGIKFALSSGGTTPTTYLANVRKAIAAGLPRQTALEALTIRAAEAAGVDRQLGSLEVGKIANLQIYDGEALSESGHLRQVFVDGQRYEVLPTPNVNAGGQGGRGRGGNPPPNHEE
jgi:imidazolonepropionase-like amidohydrolase